VTDLRDDVVDLLSSLVALDSVNPSLVPGGAGEAEVARFIAEWARGEGLRVDVLEETPGRPSVVVRSRREGQRTLMLCGHTDTVTAEGMADAHAPRIESDRLYGRGAYDMKAGVAAALLACREADGIVVAAVADEEHASLGVQEVLRSVEADAAIVTEPTEMELVVAHKGFVWAEIEVSGRAAHGSRPHLGEDAIVKAGPVLVGIGDWDERLGGRSHPLLGRGSVHASLIEGGAEMSSYPARCVVRLERRTLPGETAAQVGHEIEETLERAGLRDAHYDTLLVREPFEVDEDAEIVGAVREAARGATGEEPPIGGASYWADAAFIAAAGIPTVMFGPSGEGAHAAVEWVSIDDTLAVTRTLVETARRFCA
jgi:acetylornithine deacetylase